MRAFTKALLFFFLSVSVSSGWELSEFMIFTYGVQLSEENVKTLVRADFNTVQEPADKLEICRSHGLKLMIPHSGTVVASSLFGDDAVWGYDIMDEPISLEQLYACVDSCSSPFERRFSHTAGSERIETDDTGPLGTACRQ